MGGGGNKDVEVGGGSEILGVCVGGSGKMMRSPGGGWRRIFSRY